MENEMTQKIIKRIMLINSGAKTLEADDLASCGMVNLNFINNNIESQAQIMINEDNDFVGLNEATSELVVGSIIDYSFIVLYELGDIFPNELNTKALIGYNSDTTEAFIPDNMITNIELDYLVMTPQSFIELYRKINNKISAINPGKLLIALKELGDFKKYIDELRTIECVLQVKKEEVKELELI